MIGSIDALHRYPLKGFTPEPVEVAGLRIGEAFPCDRVYAVENGPSGFDPAAPTFIPKRRFAVLARSATVASVRTRYDAQDGTLTATAPGCEPFTGSLTAEAGKVAFARWLTPVLAIDGGGPYRVIDGEGHRFLDDPNGHVSILNLASVRDLALRVGEPVDPLRFRANIHVEGWEAWSENAMDGAAVRLGEAVVRVLRPITRCAATDVDPASATRDLNVTADLFRLYGHLRCGVYVQVVEGGVIHVGDPIAAV